MVDKLTRLFDTSKKGILCIGSSRSGTHMITDVLYNLCHIKNKKNIQEIFSPAWPYDVDNPQELILDIENKFQDTFIFASIAQYKARVSLARDSRLLKNFTLVNVRRRDKVSQYISWCVFRAQEQASIAMHNPSWEQYKHLLPYKSDYNDLEMFVADQLLDYSFNFDFTLYYEDIVEKKLPTKFSKMIYPIPHDQIVTNYEYVKTFLTNFRYKDDK